MKRFPLLAVFLLLGGGVLPAQTGKADPVRKLTDEEKVELIRGLTAEYATVKAYLPRSKKAVPFPSNGQYDKKEWMAIGDEYGPVARVGDLIQITKVDIDSDKIVLQINGGLNLKGKWYERIEGGVRTPASLDEILYDDFAGLRAAREAEDERILRVVAATPAERFESVLSYRSMAGTPHELPFAQVLTHVFNHQTHHRGQAHTLLGQFGLTTPVLDFVYFLLDTK